jgi:hypothetical protein
MNGMFYQAVLMKILKVVSVGITYGMGYTLNVTNIRAMFAQNIQLWFINW